jgi:hypothetical protein
MACVLQMLTVIGSAAFKEYGKPTPVIPNIVPPDSGPVVYVNEVTERPTLASLTPTFGLANPTFVI